MRGGGFYYEPGEIETLWVLDIDGTVVVISTALWPEPSAAAHADFAADVLDSIRIPPWSPELTARPLEPPSPAPSPRPLCPTLAVSPDGTLVALDDERQRRSPGTRMSHAWYHSRSSLGPDILLVAIGPHDIAYILIAPSVLRRRRSLRCGDHADGLATHGARRTRQRQASSQARTWASSPPNALLDAVGRPRREPDHRHQALPHGDGHRCRDRGPISGNGNGCSPEKRVPRPELFDLLTSAPDPTAES